MHILDVGGEERFWLKIGLLNEPGVKVTLFNIVPAYTNLSNFASVLGDAVDMSQFDDKQFDVVFSNSVIEHVGDFSRQRLVADEIRRVGRRYLVQTPNRWFPLEPHFYLPFPYALPMTLKIFLVRYVAFRLYGKEPDRIMAEEAVRAIRLLGKSELLRLFPGGQIYTERVLGLAKSFIAYGGWNATISDKGEVVFSS